jgi:hypothetical protein
LIDISRGAQRAEPGDDFSNLREAGFFGVSVIGEKVLFLTFVNCVIFFVIFHFMIFFVIYYDFSKLL